MPDETGTEAIRSDAPSVDESLFGDTADDAAAVAVEGEDSNKETEQDRQGSDDVEEQARPPEDLKVVVSIKGGRATIGVQRDLFGPAHRDVRRPGPVRAGAGGPGGDRKGEGQMGGSAQISGLRETRSPGKASEPARTGFGAGRGRRGRGRPAAARAAQAVLGAGPCLPGPGWELVGRWPHAVGAATCPAQPSYLSAFLHL